MATTYDYTGFTIFRKDDGSFVTSSPNSGTLSDPGTTPGEFTVGENISDSGFLSGGPFDGYYTDGSGNQYPIVEGDPIAGKTALAVYDVQLPDTTNFNDLNVTRDTFTVCFAAGTLIATPEGERAVETLTIGDTILTADGRTVPVKWVGRQTVHKLFTPAERFVPVRVKADALGEGLPHTDLVLTADHALILDGLAINAGALVNGSIIAYEPIETLPERVTYYHVETEGHEVILANGAPAETYIDYVARRAFDNYAEYRDLYGEERTITEMDLPRVSAARLLPPAIRRRLAGSEAA